MQQLEAPPAATEPPVARQTRERKDEANREEPPGSDWGEAPLMVDIMCGPNAPLSKAFVLAQWRIAVVDRVFGAEHNLADPQVQVEVQGILRGADFIWAALDCSTKSRVRDIPRRFADGREMPAPLRSETHPMGLPGLQGRDKERVTNDNEAAEFVLGELRMHQERGGASGRENPANSLHWCTPTEVGMFSQGKWFDKFYDTCTFHVFVLKFCPSRANPLPGAGNTAYIRADCMSR